MVFAQRYFFQAFPEASVNFQVSREEALARARKFVTGLGENLSGYKSSIIFDVDHDAKVYLEREVGLCATNPPAASGRDNLDWGGRVRRPPPGGLAPGN